MMTHAKIWSAIDQLAKSKGYSASGLAKKAGLDPTSFNKSKRKAPDGKPRWPSTESISKILSATESTMSEFFVLVEGNNDNSPAQKTSSATAELPLFEDVIAEHADFEPTQNTILFPLPIVGLDLSKSAWALQITNGPLAPYFQPGDILIIDPKGPARAGDPFLIRRRSEEKLGVYRGQSAEPLVGDSLGRIMAAFYGTTKD